jgi:glycyl-tRNA synthetase
LNIIKKQLTSRGISCKVDDGNATIGKRYARTDELAIPFAITVDSLTCEEGNAEY